MFEIKVDYEKCTKPSGKCLKICPTMLFGLLRTNEEDFIVVPHFKELCIGCRECEEHCPNGGEMLLSGPVVVGELNSY